MGLYSSVPLIESFDTNIGIFRGRTSSCAHLTTDQFHPHLSLHAPEKGRKMERGEGKSYKEGQTGIVKRAQKREGRKWRKGNGREEYIEKCT